ncbi:hypothetical protein NN561_010049 [Cricetulus griseus]
MAPLSAAGCLGLCWPPDVRWLQPAGPPPHAQRGFIKSGCEEAREAAWLQLAGSAPRPAAAAGPKPAAPLLAAPSTDGAPACLVGAEDRERAGLWGGRRPLGAQLLGQELPSTLLLDGAGEGALFLGTTKTYSHKLPGPPKPSPRQGSRPRPAPPGTEPRGWGRATSTRWAGPRTSTRKRRIFFSKRNILGTAPRPSLPTDDTPHLTSGGAPEAPARAHPTSRTVPSAPSETYLGKPWSPQPRPAPAADARALPVQMPRFPREATTRRLPLSQPRPQIRAGPWGGLACGPRGSLGLRPRPPPGIPGSRHSGRLSGAWPGRSRARSAPRPASPTPTPRRRPRNLRLGRTAHGPAAPARASGRRLLVPGPAAPPRAAARRSRSPGPATVASASPGPSPASPAPRPPARPAPPLTRACGGCHLASLSLEGRPLLHPPLELPRALGPGTPADLAFAL